MTIVKGLLATAALVALPALAGAASAQNLVVNGDFEAGGSYPIPDWNGGGAFVSNFDEGVHSGNAAAYFGAVGGLDSISQTLNTVAGQNYTFSFWFASDGATPNEFQAYWGGTQLFESLNVPSFGYTLQSYNVTASSALTTITFAGRNDPAYQALDDVSVTASGGVPEPASWALMLGGFGLVGGALRSRRTASVTFA